MSFLFHLYGNILSSYTNEPKTILKCSLNTHLHLFTVYSRMIFEKKRIFIAICLLIDAHFFFSSHILCQTKANMNNFWINCIYYHICSCCCYSPSFIVVLLNFVSCLAFFLLLLLLLNALLCEIFSMCRLLFALHLNWCNFVLNVHDIKRVLDNFFLLIFDLWAVVVRVVYWTVKLKVEIFVFFFFVWFNSIHNFS